MKAGAEPGSPRFQGKGRYISFTDPQYGAHGGAVLDGGVLSVSKLGRFPVRIHSASIVPCTARLRL